MWSGVPIHLKIQFVLSDIDQYHLVLDRVLHINYKALAVIPSWALPVDVPVGGHTQGVLREAAVRGSWGQGRPFTDAGLRESPANGKGRLYTYLYIYSCIYIYCRYTKRD